MDIEELGKNPTYSEGKAVFHRKISQKVENVLSTTKSIWNSTNSSTAKTVCQETDLVLTFLPDASEVSVLWLKNKLEENIDGLLLNIKSIPTTLNGKMFPSTFAFYLSATPTRFLKGLEKQKIPKKVKQQNGGGHRIFTLDEADDFEDFSNFSKFVSSQERQIILYTLINGIKAENGDSVGKINFRNREPIVSRCQDDDGIINELFGLHEEEPLNRLKNKWVKNILSYQPLDLICEYFGIKIGFYFCWLGHYTTYLFAPAIIGTIFWFYFDNNGNESDFICDLCFVLFAFFNAIWATLYLKSWKRKSAELAFMCGTSEDPCELLADPRPSFKGIERISEITGKVEIYYPEWKRNVVRYLVTVPIVSLCLLAVFVIVFSILEIQNYWDNFIQVNNLVSFLKYLPKILLAVIIPILNNVYSKIAIWLNHMENYDSESRFKENLKLKTILFQCVNSFLALFYTAFYLQDMVKLRELLAALLITRQVIGNINETIVPFAKKYLKLLKIWREKSPSNTSNKIVLDRAAVESTTPEYEDTFEDYLEMFIQFGYVTLFSVAYPLAAVWALFNNIIEIRGDAFKLCYVHKRPIGQRANSIGSWQTAMEIMGILAIMVNSVLIAQSGQIRRFFPSLSVCQSVCIVVFLEHVLLLIKMLISNVIPDLPNWVAVEIAKTQYKRGFNESTFQKSEKIHNTNKIIPQISNTTNEDKNKIYSEETRSRVIWDLLDVDPAEIVKNDSSNLYHSGIRECHKEIEQEKEHTTKFTNMFTVNPAYPDSNKHVLDQSINHDEDDRIPLLNPGDPNQFGANEFKSKEENNCWQKPGMSTKWRRLFLKQRLKEVEGGNFESSSCQTTPHKLNVENKNQKILGSKTLASFKLKRAGTLNREDSLRNKSEKISDSAGGSGKPGGELKTAACVVGGELDALELENLIEIQDLQSSM